jgi:formiminotetrahydrofolate cyclodeaminase
MTLHDFNDLLASPAPAPGGGSTAALAGAFGSALSIMVINLSTNKKAYEALDAELKYQIAKDYETLKILNSQLLKLCDDDTRAFNLVMKAVRLPRKTEEESLERSETMQKANLYALEVPLKVAEKCLQVLKHQINIARYGNKNAASDIGVGALLAYSGLEGAVLNIMINIPGISEEAVINAAIEKYKGFLEEGERLKTEIMAIVKHRITAA